MTPWLETVAIALLAGNLLLFQVITDRRLRRLERNRPIEIKVTTFVTRPP